MCKLEEACQIQRLRLHHRSSPFNVGHGLRPCDHELCVHIVTRVKLARELVNLSSNARESNLISEKDAREVLVADVSIW